EQQVQAGGGVGYGAAFVADRPMRIGIVACGYADGYPRQAPSGTPVAVAGQRSRPLGRESMDMLAGDLTAMPPAGLGGPVTRCGVDGLSGVDVAQAPGTFGYELITRLTSRRPVSVAGWEA